MTVVSSVSQNTYTGSGITGPYAYTFRIDQASDLAVIVADTDGVQTTLAYPGEYTVSGAGQRAGGTITLTNPLTSGWAMVVKRNLAIVQTRSIRNQGPTFPATIEDAIDYLTGVCQDLSGRISRALSVPETIPPSGAGAQILNFTPSSYLRVNASGDGLEGVSSVIASESFLQSGTGAVTRTMQSKAADRISVRDYGALGNGVHDDAPAIRTALAYLVSLGGGTLWFDPGTYLIGSRISVIGVSNVTFEGAGRGIAVLKASGSRTSIFSTFPEPDAAVAWADPATAFVASNLTFRGLTFDMAYDTIVDGGVANPNYGTVPYRYPADNYQYPLMLLYAIGVVVTDCEFRNCWYNAIEIYSCNDVWITLCLFRNVGDKATYQGNYSAVGIDGYSHRIHVTHNHMSNLGFGVSINAIGPNGNPDMIAGSRDMFIDDNQISDALWGAVQADGDIRRLSISRNRGNAIAKSVVFVQHSKSTTNNALGPKNVIVHDNQFDDVSTDGISLGWIDLTVGSFSVRGNRLANSLGASGSSRYGLVCRQLTETLATVAVPSSGGHVEGNDLRGSFANQYAYLLSADYTIAINNIAHDTSGSMGAAMSSTGSHSPAATGTLTIP